MRRLRFLLWIVGLVVAAAGLAYDHAAGIDRPKEAHPEANPPKPGLPLSHVVLFNNGVGYFQRAGPVDGDARVDLAFPAEDINDLLKSLVLHDPERPGTDSVSYDSPAPVERTLSAFALDLTGNPAFGQILNQARGESIEVTLSEAGVTSTITGRVLGMESQVDSKQESHLLNLSAADGLRSVPLARVQRVRFLNAALDAELQGALRVLAAGHDTKKKVVHFRFAGTGKRNVRVGYVAESPMWKTTYRLNFDKEGKPKLQGWAVVENTTDEDWNDIRLALVAGRPLSFTMDLYQPLFVPRPKVEPELFASLRPPAYTGAILSGNQSGSAGGGGGGVAGLGGLGVGGVNLGALGVAGIGGIGGVGYAYPGGQVGLTSGQFGFGGAVNRYQPRPPSPLDDGDPALQPSGRMTYENFLQRRDEQRKARAEASQLGSALAAVDPKQGLEEQSAEVAGKVFQHAFDRKISVSRQKSALVKVFDADVQGRRVSIFNEAVHGYLPLLGLRFKNTTGKPLMQGPLTVYDAERYAGDARILDLQPDEERLLAYALDQGVEVKTSDRETPGPGVTLHTLGYALMQKYTVRRTHTYLFRNRSDETRQMVIEHPVENNWVLAADNKPVERTRNQYRFATEVPAGKATRFDVAVEQVKNNTFNEPTRTFTESDWLVRHYATGYAGIEFDRLTRSSASELIGFKIAKGQLTAVNRQTETLTYRVRNVSQEDREVTFEHELMPGHRLTGETPPAPGTTDRHLFQLKVAPDKVVEKTIREVSDATTTSNLGDLEEGRARPLLTSAAVSDAAKAVIHEALRRRAEVDAKHVAAAEARASLKAIVDEQGRLRANLERLPAASAAYKRYLEKFDTQETQIEKLQVEIDEADKSIKLRQKENAEFYSRAFAE